MSLAKRLFGSAALVAGSSGIARLVAFAAAPVLTATFGPKPFGELALVNSAAALLTILALAGVDNSYMRFASQIGGPGQVAGIERFCWRYAALITALVVTTLIAAISVAVWSGIGLSRLGFDQLTVAATIALAVLGVTKVMADTRRRLQGNYRRIAVGMLLGGVLTPCVSTILGLQWRHDVVPLLVAAVLGVLLMVSIVGIPGARAFTAPSGGAAVARREIVTFGLPGMVVGAMYWVLGLSDRLILGAYVEHAEVGVYAFAASIASVGLLVNNAIGIAWFPEAVRTYEADRAAAASILGRLWARLVITLLLVWLFVVAIGGDVLRFLADPRFHEGAAYIPWLAAGTLFSGVANLSNTGLWLGKNMKTAAYAWVTAAIASVALNVLLVPLIGGLGAALTSCVCTGLVAIILMFMSHQIYALAIPWARLVATFLLVTAIGGGLSIWHPGTPVASALLKLPLIAIIALIALMLISPDWIWRAARRSIAYFRQPQ